MSEILYTIKEGCRACGGPFDPVLSLGPLCLSTFLKPTDSDPPEVPLDLVLCQVCDLVQLRQTVDPDRLYKDAYWYQSGINETMVAELRDIVQATAWYVPDLKSRIVLDVGANDGTLLAAYDSRPLKIAVEPSPTFRDRLAAVADTVITDYFPSAMTRGIPSQSISVITSIAMVYDLDNPKAFVYEVDRLLTPDGLWIVQFQDLGQMVRQTAFDNLCHEHLTYYSVKTFASLLVGTNLQIRWIEPRAINGGSVRLFLTRRTQAAPAIVGHLVDPTRDEIAYFAWRVGQYGDQLLGTIHHLRAQGQLVDLYGASTKANTLLQYLQIDRTLIRQAVERSPAKVGLETPGGRIPIVSEETWRDDPAPTTLVGIWQFRQAILDREADYLARGGSWLFPLPTVQVVLGGQPQ